MNHSKDDSPLPHNVAPSEGPETVRVVSIVSEIIVKHVAGAWRR